MKGKQEHKQKEIKFSRFNKPVSIKMLWDKNHPNFKFISFLIKDAASCTKSKRRKTSSLYYFLTGADNLLSP